MFPEAPDTEPIDWSSLHCDGVKSDFELHRGFNAATRLHRPPVMVIRRGSVIRLSGPGVGGLRSLLQSRPALGERAWEGYGRYLIDFHPLQTAKSPSQAWGDNRPEPDEPIGARESIIEGARQYGGKLLETGVQKPSRSQWFQLMEAVDTWRRSSNAARDQVLKAFEQASQKKSGTAWKSLLSPSAGSGIRGLDHVLPQTAGEARLFVEALISVMRSGDDG